MNRFFWWKITGCILTTLFCLYQYVNKSNYLTSLKFDLPKVEREVTSLKEKNKRLQYETEKFEDPNRLMQLASRPEYAHLKHPLLKDILKVEEGLALQEKK